MQIKPYTRRRQRGMTLIELIAALAVAGLVIAGALAMYKTADDTQKSNDLLSATTYIRGSLRQLYGGAFDAANNMAQILSDTRRLPANWSYRGNNSLNYPYGTASLGTSSSSLLEMTLNNVPSGACIGFVTSLQGWNTAKISNGSPLNIPLSAADRATAITNCNSAASVVITLVGA